MTYSTRAMAYGSRTHSRRQAAPLVRATGARAPAVSVPPAVSPAGLSHERASELYSQRAVALLRAGRLKEAIRDSELAVAHEVAATRARGW